VLDRLVDDKLQAIERLQDDIDTAEEAALEKGSAAFDPSELMRLRRSLLGIRKSLFHEREILVKICRRDSPFITEATIYHFRDIYDHLVKFVEGHRGVPRDDRDADGAAHVAREQRTRPRRQPHQSGGAASDLHHDDLHALSFLPGWVGCPSGA